MPTDAADARPDWWRRLARRADAAPLRPRAVLRLGEAAVGSIEPALASSLREAGLPLLVRAGEEVIERDFDAALEAVARWLHDQRLTARWRGERLSVCGAGDAVPLARVERSAARPLGIATRAVHLVATAPDGHVWVQQRAFDKATDPGCWDTLVGGLVAADEANAEALERETWEEAGLRLADLRALRRADRITVRRPVSEGYMVEHIEVFEADLPVGLAPVNQDGEVACFACVAPGDLLARLAADEFTLEAALILAASLQRRGLVRAGSDREPRTRS